jgi:hypothetical protein
MKARIVILVAILTLLLSGAMALAQGGKPGPIAWYAVQPGTASGGGYHLAALAWQASGTVSGGGYRLLAPLRATGRGTPCCCSCLPVILKSYQR